jgi:hypothetical protein
MSWQPAGELASNVSSASIASNDGDLVAALSICESGECRTEVWSSIDSQPWALRMRRDDFSLGRVTWAGGAFLVVGKNDATPSRIFTSVDGVDWSEDVNPLSDEDCGAAWFVGGAGTVLYGDPDCVGYRGTVLVTPQD